MRFITSFLMTLSMTVFLVTAHADSPSPLKTKGDPFMGDWEGTVDGKPVAVQIIAYGDGQYTAIMKDKFDTRDEPFVVLKKSAYSKASVDLIGQKGKQIWSLGLRKDHTVTGLKGGERPYAVFELKKVERLSLPWVKNHRKGPSSCLTGRTWTRGCIPFRINVCSISPNSWASTIK